MRPLLLEALRTTFHGRLRVGPGDTGRAAPCPRHPARSTGLDLTEAFVAASRELSSWVGLGERVSLELGSALDMPYMQGTFDTAYVMHVGMNLADKAALAAELYRVLKLGGQIGIYDIMRIGDGELAYPVPRAATAEGSGVATPAN